MLFVVPLGCSFTFSIVPVGSHGSELGLGVKSLHLRGLHLLSSYPRRDERTTES